MRSFRANLSGRTIVVRPFFCRFGAVPGCGSGRKRGRGGSRGGVDAISARSRCGVRAVPRAAARLEQSRSGVGAIPAWSWGYSGAELTRFRRGVGVVFVRFRGGSGVGAVPERSWSDSGAELVRSRGRVDVMFVRFRSGSGVGAVPGAGLAVASGVPLFSGVRSRSTAAQQLFIRIFLCIVRLVGAGGPQPPAAKARNCVASFAGCAPSTKPIGKQLGLYGPHSPQPLFGEDPQFYLWLVAPFAGWPVYEPLLRRRSSFSKSGSP